MEKLADLAVEKGVRDKLLLIAGGTQVTDELAQGVGAWTPASAAGPRASTSRASSCETMRERGM